MWNFTHTGTLVLSHAFARRWLFYGRVILVVVLGALGPFHVLAAEWSMEPTVSVRGDYNSNLTLTSAPHDEVWGHWVSPGVNFKGSTENLEVEGGARGDFVRYYGGQDVAITNLYFPVSTHYKSERDVFGLDGSFVRDNTLLGELQTTGVVLKFTQRNLWTINPTWTRALTEKLSLQAGYQFSDASYENGFRLGLVDYQSHTGTAGVAYQLTENDQLQITGLYMNFHVPDVRLRSEITGGQLSLRHSFSETLTVTFAGGPRQVSSTSHQGNATLSDSETVWTFNASLSKKFESARVQIEAGREINPSGFGILIQTNRAALTVSKDLTETLTASVNGQVFLASSIAGGATTITFPENRYVTASPKLSWRINDWWTLDLSYTYAQRNIESLSQTANANSTYVMLTYQMPKLSVSR